MGADVIIPIVAIVLIIGGAVAYIVKEKKSGRRCIGCPDGKACGGNCSCCSGCNSLENDENAN